MDQSGPMTVGIVLAGGGSKRLAALCGPAGGGKAAVLFEGRTFLEHVVAAMAAEVGRIVVVAAPGQTLPPLGRAEVVRDATPGAGPLAGIRDGMRAAFPSDRETPADSLVMVASCDVPRLRREVVRLLLATARESRALWSVPVAHGHRQVLVSAMRPEMLPWIDAWLADGRRDLRGLCDRIAREDPRGVRLVMEAELAAVDPSLDSFLDIDTPADLERLQSR